VRKAVRNDGADSLASVFGARAEPGAAAAAAAQARKEASAMVAMCFRFCMLRLVDVRTSSRIKKHQCWCSVHSCSKGQVCWSKAAQRRFPHTR